MRNNLSESEYVEGVMAGDRAVLGRAITLVESSNPDHRRLAQRMLGHLLPHAGGSRRIGISGVPGVGKSTFIEAFGCRLIDNGHRVAVLAVDPSSSVTRGSILGDKTRMERLATRDEAFIRPSPTGGTLGGVARKTRESILVCEAAGFDVVLVETVGVGQSETVVAEMVDVFVLLELAGAGDELQGIKRGILELADIISINKADGDNLPRAERARAELDGSVGPGPDLLHDGVYVPLTIGQSEEDVELSRGQRSVRRRSLGAGFFGRLPVHFSRSRLVYPKWI
jgi:LAO/AO transport system kinase